ncbi:unnamed protein product [Calicophoron daubneyi]|uniref:RanBD1 domain-containing protein n=1 Tax=Calicophoron daubneyi TaxID=300641 RepID=A0AAV2TFB6_CALDB
MSKRRADIDLNQDNWNDDLVTTEAGTFERADKSSLSTRKILTVKSNRSSQKTGTSGLFKSFTGFDTSSATPGFRFNFSGSPSSSDQNSKPSVNLSNSEHRTNSADEEAEYLRQLRSLNQSLLDWTGKHVKEDPYCILTPIFKDYDKHLDLLNQKFPAHGRATNESQIASVAVSCVPSSVSNAVTFPRIDNTAGDSLKTPLVPTTSSDKSQMSAPPSTKPLVENTSTTKPGTSTTFSFTAPNSSADSSAPKPPGFHFGLPPIPSSKSAPLLFKFNTTLPSTSPFAPSVKTAVSESNPAVEEDSENYVPPKPVVKEIHEEGSVYSVRCKLFYKLETEWHERGVGNLFIKPTTDDKFQLLIRADTNLGNILLNVLITRDIPFKQQKNNLTFVCVPSPPLPIKQAANESPGGSLKAFPMLIRVKTESGASELLKEIDQHRGMATANNSKE